MSNECNQRNEGQDNASLTLTLDLLTQTTTDLWRAIRMMADRLEVLELTVVELSNRVCSQEDQR